MTLLTKVPPEQRTLPALLEAAAEARPDQLFYTWADQRFTLGDVDRAADALAGALYSQLGIGPGTRVAVLMGTSPHYLHLWLALAKLGAVEVPINTAYRGQLLSYQLNSVGAEWCVCDGALVDRLVEVADDLPALQGVVVNGEQTTLDISRATAFGRRVLDVRALDELEQGGDGVDLQPRPGHTEIGCIIFTSGTTGPSKGVTLSHHHEASFGFLYGDIVDLSADDTILNYLPFFHIAAKFLTTACLVTGASMRLEPALHIDGFWDEARRHGITNFVAVGGVCQMLLKQAPAADDPDNPVRVVYAVPAPAQQYHEFQERFGVKLVEAYGSTETNLVLHTRLDESVPGSCGRPHPLFDVRIVDEADNEVPVGESGEIVVRPLLPGTISSGYDAMPERTVAAWRNLWFHTGDRGRRDEHGLFWFEDRIKDSIRRRGENISSYEVEAAVAAHPSVAEVAAVPYPSELGEEDVRVVVVLRDGAALEPVDLFHHCARTMAYFMVPRFIEFADELPRTPTQKVEKYVIRRDGLGAGAWDSNAAGWRMTREGPVRREEASSP